MQQLEQRLAQLENELVRSQGALRRSQSELEAQQQGASASTIRGRLAGLRSRRQKRPRKLERGRQCALVALRRATGEWLEGAAASRFEARQRWLALDCWAHRSKEAALASWRRARGQTARAIMLRRRCTRALTALLPYPPLRAHAKEHIALLLRCRLR